MMKIIKISALYLCLFFIGVKPLQAQYAHFLESGSIEYERRVNTYAMFQKQINKDNEAFMKSFFDEYKKKNPQFKNTYSILNFDQNRSLFSPKPDKSNNTSFFGTDPYSSLKNIIFSDLKNKKTVARKEVFEKTYLLKDSLRKINWKITDETREIAGYNCRRANALVLDSIYVVAFYAIDIPVSSGPESFTGLPGMILGLALPHDNVTIFATKVTPQKIEEKNLTAPNKGTATTFDELQKTLIGAMKDWGDQKDLMLKAFML